VGILTLPIGVESFILATKHRESKRLGWNSPSENAFPIVQSFEIERSFRA